MADVLQTLSDAMAEAVESAGASVVQVAARRRLPASGVVWSADGVIVTSHHVIENDEKIDRFKVPVNHRFAADFGSDAEICAEKFRQFVFRFRLRR